MRNIIFTIHNLEYQGKCAPHDLDAIGLNGASFLKRRSNCRIPILAIPQTINLMKGGIVYADAVNTVSPTYAKEIVTPKLATACRQLSKKPSSAAFLNGIDSKIWNPATDPFLTARYSAEDSLAKIVKAKSANKEFLQKRLFSGLSGPPSHRCHHASGAAKRNHISSKKPISQTLNAGGAFVLLASTPMPEIHREFEELKERFRDKPQVLILFEYNEELAHQIYAALDFLLVPSISEPCGLTQLIALRYGTIPIVRSTGGLKDTVFDCEDGKVSDAATQRICIL